MSTTRYRGEQNSYLRQKELGNGYGLQNLSAVYLNKPVPKID